VILAKRRREFIVLVVDSRVDRGQAARDAIIQHGYTEVEFMTDFALAQTRIESDPPHIIIVGSGDELTAARAFLQKVQEISEEILAILLHNQGQALDVLDLVAQGVAFDSVSVPLLSNLALGQAVDRAAQRLYFQFLAEQVRADQKAKGGSNGENEGTGPSIVIPEVEPSITHVAMANLLDVVEQMRNSREIDEVVQVFIAALSRHLGHRIILFFRFLPAHASFALTHSAQLNIEKLRGIGLDLKKDGANVLDEMIAQPTRIPRLRELVKTIFKRDDFFAISHFVGNECVGFTLILGDPSVDMQQDLSVHVVFHAFEISLEKALLKRDKTTLELVDQISGAYNRRHFLDCLDDEIARSRRIFMASTMVVFEIDGWASLRAKIGQQRSDAVLRGLTSLVRKSIRRNDRLARVGDHEFGLLMPHTGHLNAAAKSERLRRMIEAARFPILEGTGVEGITVSLGVSEYPSLASDAESLIRSAETALASARLAGGNRLAVNQVDASFQRDFEPRDVGSR
jgi:diguanylate cyclase (GGDEF)-like protein